MISRLRIGAPAALAVLALHAARADCAPRCVPGQVLVEFAPGMREDERAAVRDRLGGQLLRRFEFIRTELLDVGDLPIDAAIAAARRVPGVEVAEPNWIVEAAIVPDDPLLEHLWGLRNTGQLGGIPGADIRAALAWNVFRGDPELRVGVIDTGVDYRHADLAANLWTNPGEIPGNHLDDDGNGYTDDVHGYDFANGDSDPMDDQGHGTHVAGTIAAAANNALGVVGVAWRGRIVAIKFLDESGTGTIDGAIAGIEYAIRVGVALTNNSWGGAGFSQALLDAIQAAGAANQLFVAAAGNAASDIDANPVYPASYDSPFVLTVAATDRNDHLASFSNFGAASVDLGAPGVEVLSCMPGGGYQFFSGTSMATPHVAGVAALVYGRFPGIQNVQVKERILAAAVPIPVLDGRCATGARLDAFAVLAEPDSLPPGGVLDLVTTAPGSTTMGLAWTAPGDDGGVGRASSYDLRYATAPIDEASFAGATQVPTPDPQPAGANESVEVSGLAYDTTYYFALEAQDEYGVSGPLSNVAVGTTLGIPDIAATPESLVLALVAPATATRILQVSNQGEGTLDFLVPAPELLLAGVPAKSEPQPMLELPKGAADPRAGDPVVAGSGGPDPFGYRWVDSDEPGGPGFEWIDITAIGAPIPLDRDDQTVSGIPIGFEFPFYGNTFTTVNACSNGFLSFTWPGNFYLNQPLPNRGAAVPPNLVAPFWDDLDFSVAGSRAFSHTDGTRFVVEYAGVPHYGDTAAYTFEIVLYPSGEIRYQYLSMNGPVHSATTGIQDGTRTTGLQVAFNTWYVHDALLVRIFPLPQWVSVVPPASSRVPEWSSQAVELHFDPVGLDTGLYEGRIKLLSNDPDEGEIVVPVRLAVTGVSDGGETDPVRPAAALALDGTNPARDTARFRLAIAARQPVDVRIYDARGKLVRVLLRGTLDPGTHPIEWDRRDERRRRVAAGVYFCKVQAAGTAAARKVVLLP